MNALVLLFTNKFFLAPASGWFFAQVLKIIIDTVKNGFDKERLAGGGGMPSSHSATVTALMVITGIYYTTASFEFVMALFFAFIVIYDAAGVRFQTQQQGKYLNALDEERQTAGQKSLMTKAFKEKLGHTIPEIAVGIVLGIVCAVVVYLLPF